MNQIAYSRVLTSTSLRLRRFSERLVSMIVATVFLYSVPGCDSGKKTRVVRGRSYDGESSPAAQYVETILTALDHIEQNLPLITQGAERAAKHLVAGGHLYAAEDEGGFISEASGRAGGMMTIRSAPAPSEMGGQDVVLVGTLDLKPNEQQEQLRAMREAGALVILFGSAQSPVRNEADLLIGNGLSAGTVPVVAIRGRTEPICPAGPVGEIAALWVFTGELVAACTREGKMPTMYQSIFVPGSRDRNARYESHAFHEDMEIKAIPPGQAGRAYLAEIRRCLQGLCEYQIPSFQAGGRKMADVINAGHRAWVVVLGHQQPSQFGLPGDPGILDSSIATKSLDRILETIGPKDALVYVGYYDFPRVLEEDWQPLREIGVPSVWITGGRETRPLAPRGNRGSLVPGAVGTIVMDI